MNWNRPFWQGFLDGLSLIWIWRMVKRMRHRLAHKLGVYFGTVETWWQGDVLWVGFKCSTCGKVSGSEPSITERTK